MSDTQDFLTATLAPAGVAVRPMLAQTHVAKRKMDYLPVGVFGAVMGLTGLSVAWNLIHDQLWRAIMDFGGDR
jgi:hypothetical protein